MKKKIFAILLCSFCLIILENSAISVNALELNEKLNHSAPLAINRDIRFEMGDPFTGGGASYTRMDINSVYKISLTPGAVEYFDYIPDSNQYYVVETMGNLDTKLRVNYAEQGTIIDDNSGSGVNSKIEFKAIKSQRITIELRCSTVSMSGTTTIQIRKQRFAMFGYVDADNNSTLKDLQKPKDIFKDLYDCVLYENTTASHALNNDERELLRINSEIVFFTGHGYANGTGVSFQSGGINNSDSRLKMDKTKIVVWAACETARSNNSQNISFAEYSITRGAKSSVGFIDSITFSSSKTYTDRFFLELSKGKSVNEAAKEGAKALIWPWDNAKKYVVFGDGSVKITDTTVSNGSFYAPRNYNYILNEIDESYVKTLICENEYRYYKTINGYLTNSYIDMKIVEDMVNGFDDNRKTYQNVLSIQNEYIESAPKSSISVNHTDFLFKEELNRNIVYYEFNGTMVPILIIDANYYHNNRLVTYATCINLCSGEYIDYDIICG